MTAQFILTALFLMVSHGSIENCFGKKDLFGKYIITDHFDKDFLGAPVEIKMYPKPLNDGQSSKLDSSNPVPAVIVRNHKGMGERICYISEKSDKNEKKIVMDIDNKSYILDTIVHKDGKPQKLTWKNIWKTVVFTRIDSEWKQNIVSCISDNGEGVFLSELKKITQAGNPSWEKLFLALNRQGSETQKGSPKQNDGSKCCSQNQQIPTNEPDESREGKTLDIQQDSNILNPQPHAKENDVSKGYSQSQQIPTNELSESRICKILDTQQDSNILNPDKSTADEHLQPLNLIKQSLTVSDLLIPILQKIQLAAETNEEIDYIIKKQTKYIYRWQDGEYADFFHHYDDWAIGFVVNFFRTEKRYQYIDYILRDNDGESIKFIFRGKLENEQKDLQFLTAQTYSENFWDIAQVRDAIKKVREILEKEKEFFHQGVVYFKNSEKSGIKPVGQLSEQHFHFEQRLHDRKLNKDAMIEAREAQAHGKWTRDVLNFECKRRFRVYYKDKVYIFEPDMRTLLTVFKNPNYLK